MTVMTNEQFKATLRNFAAAHGMTQAVVAQKIGKPRQTVGHWFSTGIKPDDIRARVIAEHPDIFSAEYVPKEEALPLQTEPSVASAPAVSDMRTLVRIELARQVIANLTENLQYFINASADERNRFRDELGDHWKDFLELTRAMTGENALKIARDERRIKDGHSNG